MNRLKELRKEKQLSQKAIAEVFDVPVRSWQRWENGESQLKPDKAQALADYFGVSVGYLLGYSDSKTISIEEIQEEIAELRNATEMIEKIEEHLYFLEISDVELILKLTEKLLYYHDNIIPSKKNNPDKEF